jgi:WD40 repeat protein
LFQQTSRAQQPAKATAKLLHTIHDSYSYWWSPDNKTLAARRLDLTLYDAATGAARATVMIEGKQTAKSIYFTPDGSALIVHTDQVRVYDVNDGKLLRAFAPGTKPINDYDRVYKPEVVSGLNSETGQYEYEYKTPSNGEETEELPTRYISDRIISPDGKSLLVGAGDGRPQVYDLATGALKFTLEPFVQAGGKRRSWGDALGEFSPDGRFIVASYRNRMPRLWNAETGALVADLSPQTDVVYGVRFSPDSKFVATTSFDGIVKIWDAATGKLRHAVGSKKDRNYFAVWNPRSSSFVTKSLKWEINIWNAETGALVAQLDHKAAKEKFAENLTFVYSPDGKILLTQARNVGTVLTFLSTVLPVKDKPRWIAHLWDADTGALLTSLRDTKPRDGYAYYSDKFFWTPAGDCLITAGATVKLWDRRGTLLQDIDGSAEISASLSPNGKLLAITGERPVSLVKDIATVAKIVVGKLPKIVASKTYVWQIES